MTLPYLIYKHDRPNKEINIDKLGLLGGLKLAISISNTFAYFSILKLGYAILKYVLLK